MVSYGNSLSPMASAPLASSGSGPGSFSYTPAAGYDEAFAADGSVRPHFRELFDTLQSLSKEELERRWGQAQRAIRENGVTYNVYGDPRGTDRPWQLDPLPLVVSEHEWAVLEAGLTQRARLLDTVLWDLYGPQRILREGLLPPQLVLNNPAF
jgi:uncharacterized circularly permuted ATP-grasp superfamily protein